MVGEETMNRYTQWATHFMVGRGVGIKIYKGAGVALGAYTI